MLLELLVVVAALLAIAYFFLFKAPPKAFGDGKRPVKLAVPILEKTQLSHDTIKVSLGLPSGSHVLGLPCGKHLTVSATVKGAAVSRAYTPTSDGMRRKGSVDLVLKVYKPLAPRFPNGGVMSQYIESLKVGQTINIRGPMGRITYQGGGVFNIRRKGVPRVETQHIGMISGGTGITPMLQIINEVIQDPNDMTSMSLLFANKSVDDILVREELEASKKKAEKMGKTFNLHYTLDKAPADWKYSQGFVDDAMISKTMPSAGENPIILFCGPPVMWERAVQPNLDKLGYEENRCLNF